MVDEADRDGDAADRLLTPRLESSINAWVLDSLRAIFCSIRSMRVSAGLLHAFLEALGAGYMQVRHGWRTLGGFRTSPSRDFVDPLERF